ncbi:Cadmium efflux system accessory protein [Candidatus Syntrophocurvum alkaliphilum]|uniref:Cadmium efflux system accessory protein n=1 Tax=Candidatus Syntrophocurvum alkaliphilum TaxID=2293317 RepID=A0A6I6DGA5_9FIRM|nr:metalloregulator ArsR/SmtB family transcription factor [Candidatus Syntrophocurvum alkaliphilum]QGT99383.1 Cadmium efflux system accessory protein [Candidatus Syntrophocurvum alkaliphilum]
MDKNHIDTCQIHCIHEEYVEEVSKNMLNEETAKSLAELFKVLGDPTRIKVIYALMQKDLCVCDIAAVIGVSQSAVSHQLRILRGQKLVKFRRKGKVVYYSLDDDHISTLFSQGYEHVTE